MTALIYELQQLGLTVTKKIPLPVIYQTIRLDPGFRIDLMVENKVIIEVKSIESIAEVHHKQLFTYLKLSGKKLGLLVNFNSTNISHSIFRKVNGL